MPPKTAETDHADDSQDGASNDTARAQLRILGIIPDRVSSGKRYSKREVQCVTPKTILTYLNTILLSDTTVACEQSKHRGGGGGKSDDTFEGGGKELFVNGGGIELFINGGGNKLSYEGNGESVAIVMLRNYMAYERPWQTGMACARSSSAYALARAFLFGAGAVFVPFTVFILHAK